MTTNCKWVAKQLVVYNNISTRYVTYTNQIDDMKISIKCKKNWTKKIWRLDQNELKISYQL
jgi:hypothetical protein